MICDFLCNMCGKQFKSQKTLTQYNRDVHIEDDIPCSLCDKTFRTKKHLVNQKFNKRTEKESLQFDVISEWPWMQLSYHVSEQFECTEKESRWENCECYSTVGYIYMTSLHCTMSPLSSRSCLKSSKLRLILNCLFCHAISKNICLNVLESKQTREILVVVILKL